MREACELKDPTEEYWAHPLDDNLFEWHFTVQGPPGTDFEGGVYHGRIILPTEYPMKPPNIILLTVLSCYISICNYCFHIGMMVHVYLSAQ
jgi:ubiquitin-conjugating enzyme E2 J1